MIFYRALIFQVSHYCLKLVVNHCTDVLFLGLSAINTSCVVGHKGWLAGYQATMDLGKSALTKVGCSYSLFACITSIQGFFN